MFFTIIVEIVSLINDQKRSLAKGPFRFDEKKLTNQDMIIRAKGCTLLSSIDLVWHDYLRDETIQILFENCPNLSSLDLSGCIHLTDDSLFALKK